MCGSKKLHKAYLAFDDNKRGELQPTRKLDRVLKERSFFREKNSMSYDF